MSLEAAHAANGTLVFGIQFPFPHSPPFFRILKPRFLPFNWVVRPAVQNDGRSRGGDTTLLRVRRLRGAGQVGAKNKLGQFRRNDVPVRGVYLSCVICNATMRRHDDTESREFQI